MIKLSAITDRGYSYVPPLHKERRRKTKRGVSMFVAVSQRKEAEKSFDEAKRRVENVIRRERREHEIIRRLNKSFDRYQAIQKEKDRHELLLAQARQRKSVEVEQRRTDFRKLNKSARAAREHARSAQFLQRKDSADAVKTLRLTHKSQIAMAQASKLEAVAKFKASLHQRTGSWKPSVIGQGRKYVKRLSSEMSLRNKFQFRRTRMEEKLADHLEQLGTARKQREDLQLRLTGMLNGRRPKSSINLRRDDSTRSGATS